MLAQGWSVLSAFGVALQEEVGVIPRTTMGGHPQLLQSQLVDSLWTQFKPAATAHLRQLILKGKL
jgi:hypothetical protein